MLIFVLSDLQNLDAFDISLNPEYKEILLKYLRDDEPCCFLLLSFEMLDLLGLKEPNID